MEPGRKTSFAGGAAAQLFPCPGCGGSFPNIEGPVHAYLGSSAGCWNVYGKILAREFEDFHDPGIHRLTVDAYAVQHPGAASRKSAQSVWLHLAALYLILEKGADGKTATRKLSVLLARYSTFEWLEPPLDRGELSVLDVVEATNPADHHLGVQRWAASAWKAWAQHHGRVAEMVESSL